MADTIELHRIRVWFGQHVIADYTAEVELAQRYAAAMDRRFPGTRITDDVVPLSPSERPLSGEQGAS